MRILLFALLLICQSAYSDTMKSYMDIVGNIPKMQMKADPKAQAWAKAARNVLTLTGESIAETLLEANEYAKEKQQPIFCLPDGKILTAGVLNELIQQTYKEQAAAKSNMTNMTVSKMALMAVKKNYPCNNRKNVNAGMRHVRGFVK